MSERELVVVTMRARAKVNLHLRVLGRRDDGYHEIETHLLRLRLADEIELHPGGRGVRLELDAAADVPVGELPFDEENLCCRAARLFYETVDRPSAVTIHLTKRIPIAAGLGGGSSDAAAVLLGLNRMSASPLAPNEIPALAEQLGSDVPFFALDRPAAVARGRGERLSPVPAPPSRPVLVVVPDFGVSAADAYRWWDEARNVSRPGVAEPAQPVDLSSWDALESAAANDLAAGVENQHPALARVRERLEEAGAAMALLCGSGSCVAGIFATTAARDAARDELTHAALPEGWRLIATETEGSGPG